MTSNTAAARFVESVEDILKGEPYARHPVQFKSLGNGDLWGCTVCGSAVRNTDEWKNLHRKYHDKQDDALDKIRQEAKRYKMPPTYGGIG